jgi:hypothetical protein
MSTRSLVLIEISDSEWCSDDEFIIAFAKIYCF